MEESDPCLHPYRKRKFFYALAELFHEPPPVIQRLEDFVKAKGLRDESPKPSPPLEEEEDSFEYVDFEKSRASLESAASGRLGLLSPSSLHDSMQDSMLFLPPDLHHQSQTSVALSASETPQPQKPTILSLRFHPHTHHTELLDYYDLDRYCEPIPCWAMDQDASCVLHPDSIRRPMLLFCLQALDEFIASTTSFGVDGALVTSCRLARIVFAHMWEQDVRKLTTERDVVLAEYVKEKITLPGVSLDVWKLIDACWLKQKQHFLHPQELYFDESGSKRQDPRVDQWHRIRYLLQIYGLRPQTARRLETKLPQGPISLKSLDFRRGVASPLAIQLGLEYLEHVNKTTNNDATTWRRDLVSQSDWKMAFMAIETHLKTLSRDVQVFPCGSFSRGAAYGSVVDILVGLPAHLASGGEPGVSHILSVLLNAHVVEKDRVHVLSKHRLIAVIPFKTISIILDVKVYERPRSWFALLYFTGPESFTQAYFAQLLQRSLSELVVVDFDHIYDCVVDQLGQDVVASVDSEKHLFDLINSEYILPSQRM